LPLEKHGLSWIRPQASVAHPLDDGPAVLLYRPLEQTARQLGSDAEAYQQLLRPFLGDARGLIADVLTLPGLPRRPLRLARFGLLASRAATSLARRFDGPRARAHLAGCAAHSMLPLEQRPSAAIALLFLIAGHTEEWPVAKGGSSAIASALAGLLGELGGEIQTGHRVTSPGDLPPARLYLFDVSPRQLSKIAGSVLPRRYLRALNRYRYGPGASSPAMQCLPRTSNGTIQISSAAPSPAASTTCGRPSRDRWRGSILTPLPIRASSCVRLPRRPAGASTACAVLARPAAP
jgi:phytoene dehydrogenase-like protein